MTKLDPNTENRNSRSYDDKAAGSRVSRLESHRRLKREPQANEEPWVPHLRRRPRRLLRERTVLAVLRNASNAVNGEGGAAQPLSLLRLQSAA